MSPLFSQAAALLTMTLLSASALAGEVARVGLFGGSSVRTSYLPAEVSQTGVLQKELEKAYPAQGVEVTNYADNGEFIARYLVTGTYERHRKEGMQGIDVAIIRFGANDQKRFSAKVYLEQLRRLVELL